MAQKPQCGCDWHPWRHTPLAGSPSHQRQALLAQETPRGRGEQTLGREILSQAGGEPRLPPCLLMCPRLPSEDQAVVEQVNLATGTVDTSGQRLRVKPPTKESRGLAGRGPPRVQQTGESVHQRPRPPARQPSGEAPGWGAAWEEGEGEARYPAARRPVGTGGPRTLRLPAHVSLLHGDKRQAGPGLPRGP